MTHPDPELLTQLALNEPLALDADALVHIADCPQCSAEVASLQRVVAATDALRGDPTLREVIAAPDRVWERIALGAGVATVAGRSAPTELPEHSEPSELTGQPTFETMQPQDDISSGWLFSADDDPHVEPDTAESSSPAQVSHLGARRRTTVQLIAAAVVGVLVGGLFTWALTGRDGDSGDGGSDGGETTFTTSDLVGIDGHSTSGVASFEETPTGGQVTIELSSQDTGDGFIQAWLLDEDTGGMVALGVIDGDQGTFAVPSDLDLTSFNQIDISLEPYDGNPEHSAVSLARGPLP